MIKVRLLVKAKHNMCSAASTSLPPLLPPAQEEAAFRALAPVNGLPSDIEIRLKKTVQWRSVCKTQKNKEISREKDLL